MTLTSSPDPSLSGLEPTLSDSELSALSGNEPLLGGLRRIDIDTTRLSILLNGSELDRAHALEFVRQMGQSSLYARELVEVLKPHARQKVGGWRGGFTVPQRLNAISALAQVGGSEVLDLLLLLMDISTYQIRDAAQAAIEAICQRVDMHSAKVLKNLVLSLKTRRLSARRMISDILSAAPADRVLGPLIRHGLAADEWQVRQEAVYVLGKLGDKRATIRLIDALSDVHERVRRQAIWALGQIDAPISIPPLLAILDDEDELLRAEVCYSLAMQINRMDRYDEQFQRLMDRLIRIIIEDIDPLVRDAAYDSLALIDAPQARRAIKKLSHAT